MSWVHEIRLHGRRGKGLLRSPRKEKYGEYRRRKVDYQDKVKKKKTPVLASHLCDPATQNTYNDMEKLG